MKIAVIGAGPVGLVFTKELLEAGHEAVCYEASDRIGGVFARPYQGARLTSSNLVTTYSDFRDRREGRATIWDFDRYTQYLNDYTDHFGLRDHIRFYTRVTRIAPVGADPNDGVIVSTESKDEGASEKHFDRVAICTGSQQIKEQPTWPGMEKFEGEILHALDFHTAEKFAGKRVLVIGGGESSSDISLEVAKVAAATGICVRSHTGHIVWRNLSDLEDDGPNRGAADVDTSRAHHSLPHWYGPEIARRRFANQKPIKGPGNAVLEKIAEHNLEQGSSALNKFGLKNASLVRAMVHYGSQRFPGIERFEPNKAVFVDGQEFECDYVICATGYLVEFPMLEETFPQLADEGRKPRKNLYKHAIHPDYGPTIFWGGYARPAFGAIPPIGEMQARWFALLCSGERSLPSPDEMRKVIAEDNARVMRQFSEDAGRLGTITDFLRILDDLAEFIGCKPPQSLYFTDRDLWRKMMLGPITGAQFRLRGPGAKPEMAKESLMRTPVLEGAEEYTKAMVKFKLLSLVPYFGRRYRLNATW